MRTIMMRVGVAGALMLGGMVSAGSAHVDDKGAMAGPASTSAPATAKAESPLKDLAWMAGAYVQSTDRGMSEEHWSAPHGNSMMGMFRWCKADGTPSMFEMLTITREGEGDSAKTVLRLRHYSAKLGAKEEKDEPLTLVLESNEANKAVFAASEHAGDLSKVTYQRSESGGMQITVEFVPSLNRGALKFDMKRMGQAAASGGVTPEQARRAFDRIKKLAGSWRGKSTKGWSETENVRVIAGGSAVMCTSFDAHPGESMATMYHMDGDRLLLTHYCIAKNQPRLVASAISEDEKTITFTFLDGTNMKSRDTGHMDSCVLSFVDDDAYTSKWTWYQGGKDNWMEEIRNERVTADAAAANAPAADTKGAAGSTKPSGGHDHH